MTVLGGLGGTLFWERDYKWNSVSNGRKCNISFSSLNEKIGLVLETLSVKLFTWVYCNKSQER